MLLKPNSSSKILDIPYSSFNSIEKYESYIAAHLLSDGYVISENRFFFAEPKHLHLPNPLFTNKIIEKKGLVYRLSVQTDLFAKDVRIEIDGCDAEFNDNYFDMDAGALKIVQCKVPISIKNIENKIKIDSLQND